MLQKILASLGLGASAPRDGGGMHRPYAQPHANTLYNLLFCDDVALFRAPGDTPVDGPWPTLLAETADVAALRAIADDTAQEGRVRALAYQRLRAAGEPVPAKILLGVVVEVPQPQGLDVLAAFADGGVRYLNQSGKVAILDGAGHPATAAAEALLAVSQPVVDVIGPWDKPRRPPPKAGDVRMTFLVSDGLYFGEGPFSALRHDPMAGPVIAKATALLQRVVEVAAD
jgi:hypothetical protein